MREKLFISSKNCTRTPQHKFGSVTISILAFPSARGILVVVCCFGLVNVYALRVNLSVAMVAMVSCLYLGLNDNISVGYRLRTLSHLFDHH